MISAEFSRSLDCIHQSHRPKRASYLLLAPEIKTRFKTVTTNYLLSKVTFLSLNEIAPNLT